MRIVRIEEATASIASGIRNAYIDFTAMDVSVVKLTTDVVRDGAPVIGYGFNSNGRYAQAGILSQRILPRLRQAKPEALHDAARDNIDPFAAWSIMMRNEKPGGHGERSVAVGVVDMALWDVVAKIEQKPLHRLLAERFRGGPADAGVWVYAAGGYYDVDKGLPGLKDEMRRYVGLGYDTVKMKVGGAPLEDDVARIEAVIAVMDGRPGRVAIDANGRFDLDTAISYARALEPYGLRWYEEPGDPLDYRLQATLAECYSHPLATGENLFSHQDARNLLRHGGMRPDRDILQFDPALSYGLVEYLRTLQVMERAGWSPRRCIPHGGHQFALSIAAGLGLGGNESYPGIFAPFGGFADDTPVESGMVRLPDVPGIGFEAKSALMDLFARLFE